MKYRILFILALVAGIALPAFGTLPKNPPVGEIMSFKSEAGDRGIIEIHFPEGHRGSRKKVPGIIMFHGGGWKGGTSQQFRSLCHYFASRGLVAASAHYRFTASHPKGEKGSPKRICIKDAKSAIRWFKQNADALGIDPDRVITGGGSAGGHVSLLATLNPGLNDPKDPKNIDTSVVAYLFFNPAFNLKDKSDPEVFVEAHLKPDTAPMIAFWGTDDRTWLPGWNRAYKKMQTLDLEVEWWSAVGQPHSFFNREPWKSLTIAEADRFLVQQGLLQGEPTIGPPKGGAKLVKEPRDAVK